MRYELTDHFKARFGNLIRQWRESSDLTQLQVAELCGCTDKHISGLELGKRGASLEIYLKLCSLADLSFDSLFDEEDRDAESRDDQGD